MNLQQNRTLMTMCPALALRSGPAQYGRTYRLRQSSRTLSECSSDTALPLTLRYISCNTSARHP